MWKNISLGQKIIFVTAVVLIISVPLALLLLKKNDSKLLVENLEEGQASDVIRDLNLQGIPYSFSTATNSISVPAAELASARMVLAENGTLESGSLGFEIFDDASYGMTEFSQRIYYQRALQGELERTIMAFDEIRRVRVHLVLPENSLFRRDQELAKASVILTLKDSLRLGQSELLAIQNLVAAAVPKLDPEKVTVTNSDGESLSNGHVNGFQVGTNLQFKQELENYYTEKVSAIVHRVMSDENAVVLVDASINFTKSESTRQSAIPLGENTAGVLVRNSVSRSYRTVDPKVDNLPTKENSITSEKIDNEYQISSEVVKTETSPGTLRSLTVSVLLTKEVTAIAIDNLTVLVREAVGLNSERGDRVSIKAILPLPKPLEVFDLESSVKSQPIISEPQGQATNNLQGEPKINRALVSTSIRDNPYYVILIAIIAIPLASIFVFRTRSLNNVERMKLLEDMKLWLETGVNEKSRTAK
ncbi:flagellar basal-body MS-ring/collar protein FliF [Microbulbifer sp. TYP-18]|uniref:flagellar basal-body MS-ring/collar protein FliF n=1 Tax=Microbulbifer sp. TYP-18 TaxID=3230024 RepID=UPI0034C5BE51